MAVQGPFCGLKFGDDFAHLLIGDHVTMGIRYIFKRKNGINNRLIRSILEPLVSMLLRALKNCRIVRYLEYGIAAQSQSFRKPKSDRKRCRLRIEATVPAAS